MKKLVYNLFTIFLSVLLGFSAWNINTLTVFAEECIIEENTIEEVVYPEEVNADNFEDEIPITVEEPYIEEPYVEVIEEPIEEPFVETVEITPIETTEIIPVESIESSSTVEDTLPNLTETNTTFVTLDINNENRIEENFNNNILSTSLRSSNDTNSNAWNIHVANILYINTTRVEETSFNGHAIAYTSTQNKPTLSTQNFFNSRGAPVAGPLSWSGGSNRSANGIGYNYQFQNKYVLSTEGEAPTVLLNNEEIDSIVYITKIQYRGNNELIVTLSNNETQVINDNELYINPVYKATPYWYLNYNYIDNISTGSGSWSNLDGVVTFSHIFSNPEEKSPTLTPNYNFEY